MSVPPYIYIDGRLDRWKVFDRLSFCTKVHNVLAGNDLYFLVSYVHTFSLHLRRTLVNGATRALRDGSRGNHASHSAGRWMFYFNLKPSEELSELLPRPTFGLRQAQPTPRSDGTKDAFRPSVDA